MWYNSRFAGTVGATLVLATWAGLLRPMEKRGALAASPAHALTRLPVHQVLPALPGRSGQGDFPGGQVPVGDDGPVLGALLFHRSPLLAALGPLGLRSLGRDAVALLAAAVLAVGALLGEAKAVAALVALAADPHLNGLLDAHSMAVGRMPLAGRELNAEPLAKLLGPLLEDLVAWDLNRTVRRLWCLGTLRGRFAGRVSSAKLPMGCVLCKVTQHHGEDQARPMLPTPRHLTKWSEERISCTW